MSLIKSISGIRGTIGGSPGENLTPIDIVESTTAYALWLKEQNPSAKVVIGRDGRISGELVQSLVMNTLLACGIDVLDVGLSTTPTVEVLVPKYQASGGIILTASHNPREWNALKLLNHKGEFISKADGDRLLALLKDKSSLNYASVDELGTYSTIDDAIDQHVQDVLDLALVDAELVRSKKFHLVVDCINSTGALAMPALLDAMGCTYDLLNGEIDGEFAHNPEPLPKNLQELMILTPKQSADMGIALDPDVDRLAIIAEDGSYFGEEYTIVICADYILGNTPGPVVSNLSSSRALADIAAKYNCERVASAVGEVNVVQTMKDSNAVFGGEGNGGVIYPASHYGRDALVGVALILSYMAKTGKQLSQLRASYPSYSMSKNKIPLKNTAQADELIEHLSEKYADQNPNTVDGLKIDFPDSWIHLRKSNTEPIIRVYTEHESDEKANALAKRFLDEATNFFG